MTETNMNPIAILNDAFRTTFIGGIVVLTAGVQTLDEAEQRAVLQAVQSFTDFTEDNDPYQEHDCAVFVVNNKRYLFKIDYYDLNLEYGSENPEDPSLTKRVMTVMSADEY